MIIAWTLHKSELVGKGVRLLLAKVFKSATKIKLRDIFLGLLSSFFGSLFSIVS